MLWLPSKVAGAFGSCDSLDFVYLSPSILRPLHWNDWRFRHRAVVIRIQVWQQDATSTWCVFNMYPKNTRKKAWHCNLANITFLLLKKASACSGYTSELNTFCIDKTWHQLDIIVRKILLVFAVFYLSQIFAGSAIHKAYDSYDHEPCPLRMRKRITTGLTDLGAKTTGGARWFRLSLISETAVLPPVEIWYQYTPGRLIWNPRRRPLEGENHVPSHQVQAVDLHGCKASLSDNPLWFAAIS